MNGKQRGVALIIVLFMMVLMVMIAVRINERWQQLLLRSQYQQDQIESRWSLAGAEALARYRLAGALRGRQQVSLGQPWQAVARNLKLEGIEAQGLIRDRDNCFNLNALSQAKWNEGDEGAEAQKKNSELSIPAPPLSDSRRQAKKMSRHQLVNAVMVFNQLIINSGYEAGKAQAVTMAVLDWFGTQMPAALSQQQQQQNNFAGNEMSGNGGNRAIKGQRPRLMVDISQLREIKEIDQPLYLSLSRQVCIHQDNQLAININTLTEQQAPLLSALITGQLSVDQAKNILQRPPANGWADVDSFLRSNNIALSMRDQPQKFVTESHYFELLIWVKQSEHIYPLRTLLLRKQEKWFILQRRYGWGE